MYTSKFPDKALLSLRKLYTGPYEETEDDKMIDADGIVETV